MPETFASARYGKPLTLGQVVNQGGQGRIWQTNDPSLLVKQFEPAFITDDTARQEVLKHQVARAYQTFCVVNKTTHAELKSLPREYVTVQGNPAYLMQKADGELLMTLLQGKPMAIKERLALAAALARAIRLLHAAQICHADPHPENFMVRKEDGAFTVFVLDIDGGGLLGPPGPIYPLSQPGRVYKAPELSVMGWEQLHKRSLFFAPDDWALAVLLYRILVDDEGPFPTVAQHPDHSLHSYTPCKPYDYRDTDAAWPQPWQEELLGRTPLPHQLISLFYETFAYRFEPQRERNGRARPTADRWEKALEAAATPLVVKVSILKATPPPPVRPKASRFRAAWWATKVRRMLRPQRRRVKRALFSCLGMARAAFGWRRAFGGTVTAVKTVALWPLGRLQTYGRGTATIL
jgi:serine/threonine protein kinase